MRKLLGLLCLVMSLTGSALPGLAAAQGARIDSAFSDELISQLGYPLAEIHVGPDGIDAPDWLAPGPVHVRLSVDAAYIGYLNIVRPPAGLDPAVEVEQMLLAGAHDLAQDGWMYFGGTNTPLPGETASFVINLAPGVYKFAGSYYSVDDPSDEVMQLAPFSVGVGATPVSSPVSATPAGVSGPAADVSLTMTDDLQYLVAPGTVTTGPHIWKLENAGKLHAHHVVIFKIPEGYTDEEIVAEYQKLMNGEQPNADSFVSHISWAGYAAMQSGGTVTWTEFDFSPGTYAVICFIFDQETNLPHVLDGMVTQFIVK